MRNQKISFYSLKLEFHLSKYKKKKKKTNKKTHKEAKLPMIGVSCRQTLKTAINKFPSNVLYFYL